MCALTVMTVLSAAACSDDDDEKMKQPKEAWLRDSFLLEAYTAGGEDPYLLDDGTSKSNFPLGVTISGSDMMNDEGWIYDFRDDGNLYYKEPQDEDWRRGFLTYQVEGNRLNISDSEGYYGFFLPATQIVPPGYDIQNQTETNEIVKKTDTELIIKSTWVDPENTTLIATTHFCRITLDTGAE